METINNKTWVFDYSITQQDGQFTAMTPYRQIGYIGTSEKEAIGSMLRGVAELAWSGSLHPDDPYRKGAPPLQHVMQILNSSLEWHIARRREQIEHENKAAPETPDSNDVQLPNSPRLNRLNEIISGLATSIAALARVKEL